jgi:hypothetical protein
MPSRTRRLQRSYAGAVNPRGSLRFCAGSRSCAWRTIAGYEAIHMIRKGQAYGSAVGAKVGLVDRLILGLFAATN